MRDIFIPATGMARDDVILESWLKQPGDAVSAGDIVAVVETSKAIVEVEADSDGILGEHLVAEQQAVAPGTTISHVLQNGESPPAGSPSDHVAEPEQMTEPSAEPTVTDSHPGHPIGTSSTPRHHMSPRARRLAAEREADALAESSAATEPTPVMPPATPPPPPKRSANPAAEVGPATGRAPRDDNRYRQAVSNAVSQSWRDIPHFAVTRELRMTRLAKAYGQARLVIPELTITDVLLRALALAFVHREQRTDLAIGLAVATDQGVAIPVIPDVPRLDLLELSAARRDAVQRAKSGRAGSGDAVTPTTTLSNLGALGVDQFTGIVPVGQTSLITVGRLAERPIVKNGKIRAALTMHVTVNADHRTWDGEHSARLLERLASIIDEPALLLGFGKLHAPTECTAPSNSTQEKQ